LKTKRIDKNMKILLL